MLKAHPQKMEHPRHACSTLIVARCLLSLSLLALPITARAANLSPPASPVTAQAAMAESALTQVLVLIDARLQLAPNVARYKWNTQGAIEDRLREDKIIAALGRQAAQAGLPPDWAEQFFRAQIEASKAIQFALFAQWQQQGAGPFAQAPDLARETRPKLDRLTPQLLQALAAAWPLLCNAAPRDEIAARIKKYWASAEHQPAVAQLASAPLLAACPEGTAGHVTTSEIRAAVAVAAVNPTTNRVTSKQP